MLSRPGDEGSFVFDKAIAVVGYTLGSWRSPIPVHRKESKRAAYWSCCLLHTAYCVLRTAVSENKRKRFKRSIAITSKPCKNI